MSSNPYAPLFDPIKIGKLKLPNRIVMAPMCSRLHTADGEVTQATLDHYRVRARGGAAMLIIEATRIDDKYSSNEWNVLSASSERYVVGLSHLAETIQENGCIPGIQLVHAGRQSSNVSPCIAPSAIPDGLYQKYLGDRYVVREITPQEIDEVIDAFGKATALVKHCGFEAVEIHAAHGYLPNNFLTPSANERTDAYGGSLENRARFSLEMVRCMRDYVGPDFPIIYRYNGDDYVKNGFEITEAKEFALMLEEAGIDAHHVTAGIGESWEYCDPPIYVERGSLVHLAEAVKEVATLPVIAVASIDVPLAADVVRKGKADIIAMGRGFLADPDIPNKAAAGEVRAIRHCIRCNESCLNGEMLQRPQRCDVNFLCGRETSYAITNADTKRRVVVVGGGAAGMEAARVASLRGHEAILLEKTDQLGGQLHLAAALGFKDDLRALMDNQAYEVEEACVDIRMNMTATIESLRALKPDALIVAAGVEAKFRDVAGVDLPHVEFPVDLLNRTATAGDSVIIAGGGWLGCDLSVYLAQLGKKVILTTKKGDSEDLIPMLEPMSRKVFMDMMADAGVEVKGGHQLVEITDGGARFAVEDGTAELEADTVVPAWGFKPNREFHDAAKDLAPYYRIIGDCVRLGNLRACIWPGFLAGYEC